MDDDVDDPSHEIIGIVHANGLKVLAPPKKAGVENTLAFTLLAWKHVGSDWTSGRLQLICSVLDAELPSWMAQIQPFAVLRLRIRFAEHGPTAEAVEIIGPAKQARKLNRIAQAFSRQPRFADTTLGSFWLNPESEDFEAEIIWRNGLASLRLVFDPVKQPQALEAAKNLIQEQEKWDRRVRVFVEKHFLDMAQRICEDDEGELSPKAFRQRLTLEAIDVFSDGDFRFWFEDGEMLGGHSIEVSANLKKGPHHANMLG